jgi:toxin ParE1/3/4
MSYLLTRAAERDIRDVLRYTLKHFGPRQLDVYEEIISKGLEMVGDNPDRGGALDRPEIAAGVKLFHLELAVGRSGGASHCIYYTHGIVDDGELGAIILRILHESMEPRYRVVRSLAGHKRSRTEAPARNNDPKTGIKI